MTPVPKTPARRPKTTHKPVDVKITAAKGRPMLSWVGKRPLTRVTSFPAQHIETFDPSGDAAQRTGPEWDDWPAAYPRGGLLFHGDNKEVLAHLLANGFRSKVDLIYIDPPFDSGADYVRRVSLRGAKGTAKLDGEGYTLGEQIQYTDIWANDNYLQFMYERLLLLRELLDQSGSLYLHCDYRRSAQLRLVVEEVFGADNFRSEIVWRRTTSRAGSRGYNHIHDTILFISKSDEYTWNTQHVAYSSEYVSRAFNRADEDGRRFQAISLTASGTRSGPSGGPWRGIDPASIGSGRHWAVPGHVHSLLSEEGRRNPLVALDELDAMGRIAWPSGGGVPRFKQYEDDLKGVELQSIWTDFVALGGSSTEATDYPTQKPEALLRRILAASSNPGDLVLDCFVGSGTTAAVAQRLGRRWIGCDINNGAIQTSSKRLQDIINEQIGSASQTKLVEGDSPAPAQRSFTTWRVNDYDLQVQHNEAVNLAVEHIGIQRTRTDRFFDGTLGKSLVKIARFTHPLSPADLEEIRQELDARPDDDRNVTVVCLGIEIAAQAWLEDWNRHRRGRNAVNRIEVIELRTDERYGAWLAHEPAKARVHIRRAKGKLHVTVKDFISPTIVKRLAEQTGVVEPRIDDWRAMVDCVMIDRSYDGEVFDIALSDVPERKSDLVSGTYELDAPKGKTTVAVKIVDMLGEEVLVTAVV